MAPINFSLYFLHEEAAKFRQRVPGMEEPAQQNENCHQQAPSSPVISLNFSSPIGSQAA